MRKHNRSTNAAITAADVVIVGCGMAGTAAMLSAAETSSSIDPDLRIVAVEAAGPEDWGGSSRWTGANIRMPSVDKIQPDFVEEFMQRTGGKADERIVRQLADKAAETTTWVESKGISFTHTSSSTRVWKSIQAIGHGLAIISALRAEAEKLGTRTLLRTKAERLELDKNGAIKSVWVRRLSRSSNSSSRGKLAKISTLAVILASGGFAGNPEMLSKYVGKGRSTLGTVAPGTINCKGDGIRMAVEVGAKTSGQYDAFQGELVDARSELPFVLSRLLQYGIVVNQRGERFINEGAPQVEISDYYNYFGKSIAKQPNQIAYLILDQKILKQIPDEIFTMGTRIPPIIGEGLPPISVTTIEEIAEIIGAPPKRLIKTITAFNEAIKKPNDLDFSSLAKKDSGGGGGNNGSSTTGVVPKKSNFAKEIKYSPFVCLPLKWRVAFTFGGITIDTEARVLSKSREGPIPGLYAAGETVGIHYLRYPAGSLVLESLVFGKLAGRNAVDYVKNDREN